MKFYFDLFLATSVLTTVLVLIKTFMFFAGDYTAGFADWLYFSKYSIFGSRNELIVKAKKRQNTLSVFILVLVILALLFLLLWRMTSSVKIF